ncbi:MAG: 1,4-alpha-glucan-branching enzyme, partial [Muribaculaceae bacterium]|nr:1,4-alpha-glucan-branching enzyme [Muribaculaceae bacterium]
MPDKTSTPQKTRRRSPKVLPIIKNDPWLEPYAEAITGRHNDAVATEKRLTSASGSLSEFANAHQYFGLHRLSDGSWIFREWAPNATAVTLIGDFNNWKPTPGYSLRRLDGGVWEGSF